jgi:hypothetical protein
MNNPDYRKPSAVRLLSGNARSQVSQRRSFFGSWLPLLSFYDPPCHADGSPWNGHEDPGFRVTTLVVGWFGYGASITVGSPHPIRASKSMNADTAIAALDERVREARLRGK